MRDTSELSRLQANEILSAEIITTPGARYASDVKAVIRIRTIRQRGQGLSGSFYADYNQGHAGKGNEGITLNYRTGGLDIFAKTYFREMGYRLQCRFLPREKPKRTDCPQQWRDRRHLDRPPRPF